MLSTSLQAIYALVDRCVEETGDAVYVSITRAFDGESLRWCAEVRSGELRGKNYPMFDVNGEHCLCCYANTQDDAVAALAVLCSLPV